MTTPHIVTSVSPKLRRMGALLLVAAALTAGLFALLQPNAADGSRHRAGNGPDFSIFPPPPAGNSSPFVYGSVYVDGAIAENGVVTMSFDGKTVSTPIVSLPQFRQPIFMFDTRPAREMSATFGSEVQMVAQVGDRVSSVEKVRLYPDQYGEMSVPLWIGAKPEIKPLVLPPAPLLPTDAITNMVASHQMDAGDYHTCMIVTGQLRCWGNNSYRQVGIGDRSLGNFVRGRPAPVTDITQTVRAVAAGQDHTCVVLLNGRVQCFGHRLYGAVGSTTTVDVSFAPVDVQGIDNAVDIVAGASINCVLVRELQPGPGGQEEKRRIKCWGRNTTGQLGIGSADLAPHPVPEYVRDGSGNPLEEVTSISAKGWHVCAVVAGGVQCWGSLMQGPLNLEVESVTTPRTIIAAGSGVTYVEVGHHNSCAIQAGGAAYCWGSLLPPAIYTPTLVPGLPTDIAKLAITRYSACALSRKGSVHCWGMGEYQQSYGILGIDATQPVTIPVAVNGITNAVDITAGELHVCVRTSDGGAKCWGSNHTGQIGDNTTPAYPYPWFGPTLVTATTEPAAGVTGGYFHSCTISTGGQVRCWGANGYGQLGNGFTSHFVVTSTTVVNLPHAAKMLAAGMQHTCALLVDGSVHCWGRNDTGQLGNASITSSSVPVTVTGLSGNFQSIAAGDHHTCALRSDGVLYCWGVNESGQLSLPPPSFRAVAEQVLGLTGEVTAFATGDDHTCAVIKGSIVQCWGNNAWGQLGNGVDVTASSQPVTVTGIISGATAVAAGRGHTCAQVGTGVKCWGAGQSGQLGDGVALPTSSVHSSTTPVDVIGLAGPVTDLKASGSNTCVRLGTGETLCWGAGSSGQLGRPDLTVNSYSVPISITALGSSVTQLDVSFLHMCARLQDGSLRCWGDNMYGQIGNGVSLIRPEPSAVVDVQPARWTYMLYLAGDNDLSFYLDNVSKALDRLPSSPDLNVVLFFDGQGNDDSYVWSTRDGTLNKWRIDEAASSTGDAATLTQFIDWAHSSFPAEHYYLSIANHGRGTSGIGWDTQNGSLTKPLGMTPTTLRQALANATNNGLWKIDVLHFDACLMAMLEVAHQVKDYANYMIASQNLTAAFYPYDQYAQEVLNNPGIAPRDLAVNIAKGYFDADYLRLNEYPRTISVVDLNQMNGITNAVNNLATAAADHIEEVKGAVTAARQAVQVFDASPEFPAPPSKEAPAYYTLARTDEYADLRHLAQLLQNAPNPAVRTAAQNLDNALNVGGYVVYNDKLPGTDRLVSGNTWDLSNSNGVAIYFPLAPGAVDYNGYMDGSLFTFTGSSEWDAFLAAYYAATNTQVVDRPDPGIPPVLKPSVPITTHCADNAACLWGAVYDGGLPVEGAVVSLTRPNGSPNSTTAIVAKNEAYPVFRLPLTGLDVQPGERLTLTAIYSGTSAIRSFLYDPAANEQEVNMMIETTQAITTPEDKPVPVATGIRWAMVYPQTIDIGEINLNAEGMTSDGSPIALYQWSSDLDGELGTLASLTIPAKRLRTGVHTISVVAINEQGVASPPFTQLVTVTVAPAGGLLITPDVTSMPVGGERVNLTVRVLDRAAEVVADGTPVNATTSAGTLVNANAVTAGGLATFTLQSPTQAGSARVRIAAGAARAETTILFTPAAADLMDIRRGAANLPADGQSTTTIRVRIADRYDNPIPDLDVIFAATSGTVQPTAKTGATGWAQAVFTAPLTPGPVIVTATYGSIARQVGLTIESDLAGCVFADLNRNGKRDGGEPPMDNVRISVRVDPTGQDFADDTAEDCSFSFAKLSFTRVQVSAPEVEGLTWTTPQTLTITLPYTGTLQFGGAFVASLPLVKNEP